MKSTELRIGNLVQYNGNLKETGKITTIVQDFISGLDYCQINYRKNKKHWLINIEPIPLTEELLLKFGFEKSKHGFFYIEIPKAYNAKISFSETMDCQMCQSGLGFNIELKHVHQLQNLYFALTNNELTIKL